MFAMPLAGKHPDRRSNFNGSPLGCEPQHTAKNLKGGSRTISANPPTAATQQNPPPARS